MKLVADLSNLVTKLCSCKKRIEYFCCAVRKSTFDAHNKKEAILRVSSSQQLGQSSEDLGDSCRKPTELGVGIPCSLARDVTQQRPPPPVLSASHTAGLDQQKPQYRYSYTNKKALCFPGGSGFSITSTEKFTDVL